MTPHLTPDHIEGTLQLTDWSDMWLINCWWQRGKDHVFSTHQKDDQEPGSLKVLGYKPQADSRIRPLAATENAGDNLNVLLTH